MFCTKCGTEVPNEYSYCSNCGAELTKETDIPQVNNIIEPQQRQTVNTAMPLQYQSYDAQQQSQGVKFNGMSIAGFILSLCAFITDEAGILCAILGLVFSIIGLTSKNQIKSRGKGFAIAGIAISGVYFLMILCALLFLGSVFSGIFWASRY